MPAPFPSARIVVTVVTPPDASPDGRQDRSAGADVVLIPGLASHPSVWDAVVERLGDGPRIHVVHVRGFAGLEPGAMPPAPWSRRSPMTSPHTSAPPDCIVRSWWGTRWAASWR